MYRVYNRFGDGRVFRWLLSSAIDPIFFGSKQGGTNSSDLNHYLNMVPARRPDRPYIIEFEHIGALYGFVDDEKQINHVKECLLDSQCAGIICSSEAARMTLKKLLEKDYGILSEKTSVVYPAICQKQIRTHRPWRFNSRKKRLLFVGNLGYLKGLEEILLAIGSIPQAEDKLHLTIISNDADVIIDRYLQLKSMIEYHTPDFSKNEILDRFFSDSDLFVMPTKRDTFGFAIIDALTCGTPVLATKQFAIPEMIKDGKDGLLIPLNRPFLDNNLTINRSVAAAMAKSNPDNNLVKEIRQVLVRLCAGKYDLESMSTKILENVQPGGRFSAKTRNKSLLQIYNKALEKERTRASQQ